MNSTLNQSSRLITTHDRILPAAPQSLGCAIPATNAPPYRACPLEHVARLLQVPRGPQHLPQVAVQRHARRARLPRQERDLSWVGLYGCMRSSEKAKGLGGHAWSGCRAITIGIRREDGSLVVPLPPVPALGSPA
jgi:hypothetical protein